MTRDPELAARERAQVDRRVANGETEREIARAMGISRSKVWSIKQDLKRQAVAR